MIINHLIACAWYHVGQHGWVKDIAHKDIDWFEQYTIALHWCIVQFTPGASRIQPVNVGERIFAILVLLFAMVVFSSFVGAVTNASARLFQINSAEFHQLWNLKRYLRQENVDRFLSRRVNRYVRVVLNTHRNVVQYSDVAYFKLLSEPILNDLQHFLFSRHLVCHPFLAALVDESWPLLHRLCGSAVKQKRFSKGDTLFHVGESSREMYIIISGSLIYEAFCEKTVGRRSQELSEEMWCAEPCLWTPWHHGGYARSAKDSEVVSINAVAFRKVFTQEHHPVDAAAAKLYGTLFVNELNKQYAEDNSLGCFPSDIPFDVETTTSFVHMVCDEYFECTAAQTPKAPRARTHMSPCLRPPRTVESTAARSRSV